MGYYTTLNGQIILSQVPSFEVWDEIKDISSFYFLEGYEPENYITLDYINGKFYGFSEDMDLLVTTLAKVGITATGSVDAVGEEQPDIWRVVLKDGTATKEIAKMVWPDGSEYR